MLVQGFRARRWMRIEMRGTSDGGGFQQSNYCLTVFRFRALSNPFSSHFSIVTEASPNQHQVISPNVPSNSADQQQQHQHSSLPVTGQGAQVGDVDMSIPGAELFLSLQMNEIRSPNGDVVRMIPQSEEIIGILLL